MVHQIAFGLLSLFLTPTKFGVPFVHVKIVGALCLDSIQWRFGTLLSLVHYHIAGFTNFIWCTNTLGALILFGVPFIFWCTFDLWYTITIGSLNIGVYHLVDYIFSRQFGSTIG